jgi:hypothetical protein
MRLAKRSKECQLPASQNFSPGGREEPISIAPASLDRQIGQVRLDEEIQIGLVVEALGAGRIFEIGTFEGGTTRFLADKAGEGGEVFTLGLSARGGGCVVLLGPDRCEISWSRGGTAD